jgi:hypothetical protein
VTPGFDAAAAEQDLQELLHEQSGGGAGARATSAY